MTPQRWGDNVDHVKSDPSRPEQRWRPQSRGRCSGDTRTRFGDRGTFLERDGKCRDPKVNRGAWGCCVAAAKQQRRPELGAGDKPGDKETL